MALIKFLSKKLEREDMIHEIKEYVKYLDGVHKRTMQYVKAIPEELLDWRPSEDKFSIGDLFDILHQLV